MFCKWCGLESETSDVCSWCRRPFSTSAAPTDSKAVADEPGAPTSTSMHEVAPAEPRPGPAAPAQPVVAPFADDLDDDLNPIPFAAPASASAPPAAPPQAQTPPPASPPPATPRPSAPAAGDRPDLQAIPLRRPGGAAPPPIIPIARTGQNQPTVPPVAPSGGQTPIPPLQQRTAPATPPPVQRSTPPAATPPTVPPATTRPATPLTPLTPLTEPPADVPAPAAQRPAPAEPEPLELPTLQPEADDEPAFTPVAARRFDMGGVRLPGAPAPATAVPKNGGRTWYCRWCGMQSETPDKCSWCHKEFGNIPAGTGKGPSVTMTHSPHGKGKAPSRPQPQQQPPARPTVTTREAPKAPAQTRQVQAPALATNGAAQVGGFQAAPSKYYKEMVLDTVSGAHYDADTGKRISNEVVPVEDVTVDERAEQFKAVGIYAAVLVVLAALAAGICHVAPGAYLGALAVSNVAAGMALPLLRVVPFGEDDSSDIAIALALMVLLGPLVGGIVYGVIGMMKQDANPAIVAIFLSYLVLRLACDAVTPGHTFQQLLPFAAGLNLPIMIAQWMTLATVAGWYGAGMFHKPDE